MKCWCDLSWREKCKIQDGEVNTLKYLTGYTFDVKQKVKDGEEQKDKLQNLNQGNSQCNDCP